MTLHSSRFARVLLPVLAIAVAAPLAAQDAGRVPGNKYAVDNATGAQLTCRYRVNSTSAGSTAAGWQTADAVAAGGEFSHTVGSPGETLSLECGAADTRTAAVTVRPGARYEATKGADGKVVVARKRA